MPFLKCFWIFEFLWIFEKFWRLEKIWIRGKMLDLWNFLGFWRRKKTQKNFRFLEHTHIHTTFATLIDFKDDCCTEIFSLKVSPTYEQTYL